MKDMLENILISEKELNDINFKRLRNALLYIKTDFIDSGDNMCLTANSLIDINNIITGLNNISLRKVNVKPCIYNKMYMDKGFVEDELYQSGIKSS